MTPSHLVYRGITKIYCFLIVGTINPVYIKMEEVVRFKLTLVLYELQGYSLVQPTISASLPWSLRWDLNSHYFFALDEARLPIAPLRDGTPERNCTFTWIRLKLIASTVGLQEHKYFNCFSSSEQLFRSELKWCRLLVTLQLFQCFKLEYNFYTKAAWCPWQNSNLQNHRVLNSGALPICIQGHNNSNLFSSSED